MDRAAINTLVASVLDAADPAGALERSWPGELDDADRVVLLAFGKGSVPMGSAAAERVGGRIRGGLVVGVPELVGRFDPRGTPIQAIPANHPLPTPRNLDAADAIERLASTVTPGDTVLVLVSGGGSAQLTAPAPGLSLDDIRSTTDALLRAGATIEELNAVRKHLDRLKGGRLAALLAPARTIVLIISDVMGDKPDVISSGPTAPDASTFADALSVLESRRVSVPPPVREHLEGGARGAVPETPKPGDSVFARVEHRVIANNALAVQAAAAELAERGYAVETRTGVTGEAAEIGRTLGSWASGASPGAARVWGGESTVVVGNADGLGGRNQELALAAAGEIAGGGGAWVLSLGTDGVDGPTDAAGAVVSWETAARIERSGTSVADALARHDSHRALGAADALIRTGPTGTNVNDVMVALRSHAS